VIDKEDALIIAQKLEAEIDDKKKNRPHDLAVIYYNGKWVASFGIRRGSRKSEGHDHIPKDIHWPPHKCKECAKCNYSKKDWIEDMIAKGYI
jgi:hypothetical protein